MYKILSVRIIYHYNKTDKIEKTIYPNLVVDDWKPYLATVQELHSKFYCDIHCIKLDKSN